MNYSFSEDLIAIQEILGITQVELASLLGVQQVTLSRNKSGKTQASEQLLERVYNLAFERKIRLGKIKQMLWAESINQNHKLLFHGAKSEISGEISVEKSRINNDFGQGFYTGEKYDQAISFVSGFDRPSVYFLDFNADGLTSKKYEVNRDWMLTIAYYRDTLNEYESHPVIKKLKVEAENCDYIIAPIADNRMFQIINSFIEGEITDEQCKHCLAATNLGYQYVFKSKKAARRVKMLERSYICSLEKEYYKRIRTDETKMGEDKVKVARIQYRGKGKYIDEILK